MNKYEFNATNLIAETFEKRGVLFDVVSHHGSEHLLAGFSVDCGPNVIMRFISRDNDNDVAARIFGLITNTPKEKRARVMEACNVLNDTIRFMKFSLDTDGDINVDYAYTYAKTRAPYMLVLATSDQEKAYDLISHSEYVINQ